MIPSKNRIKNQSNTTNEVLYATISKATTAASVPAEIVQRNEEKTDLRQTGKTLSFKSRLAENKKAKRQEKKKGALKNMESKTVGFFA